MVQSACYLLHIRHTASQRLCSGSSCSAILSTFTEADPLGGPELQLPEFPDIMANR